MYEERYNIPKGMEIGMYGLGSFEEGFPRLAKGNDGRFTNKILGFMISSPCE